MPITKFTGATNTIQNLSDRPNQNEGLTAAQLKLKFDQAAIDTEQYLNDILTPEIDELDAENMKKTGDQTIQGVKIFESSPIVPTPSTDMQASTKKYVDDKDIDRKDYIDNLDAQNVKLTGNQTVNGIKTFEEAKGNWTGLLNGEEIPNSEPGLRIRVENVEEQLADMTTINVKQYGAIGDGISHQLSEKFATLTSAQAKYPNAGITSLTQELNWAVFMQCFYLGSTSNIKVYIPNGIYYIKDSLTFGNTTTQSVELGNFIIEGNGTKSTKLIFDLQDTTSNAFNIGANVNSLTVKDIFLKNNTMRKGVGIYIPAFGMQIKFSNVTVFNFYVGFDLKVIVSNFDTCIASACCCGFRIRFATSTTFNNCYSQLSVKDGVDLADFVGVNWYIEECVYTSFISCASDGASAYTTQYGYKFVSASENVVCTLDSCGCEGCYNAMYINSPTAVIKVVNISTYNNKIDGIFAHVESGKYVEFDGGRILNSPYKITKGSNIGNGVVRVLHNPPTSSGNPAYYNPALTTDRSVYGFNDCTFDIIPRITNQSINEGRGIFFGTTLNLKLIAVGNGTYACADINIIPLRQEEDSSDIEARSGRITLVVNNSSNYIRKHIRKDNANITVSSTDITDGKQFIISPLVGVPYGGSCLFIVNTYTNKNNDHNQKTVGTYTGRTAIQFSGNDY